MSVTDHDTVAGLAEAREAASRAGIEFVDGIEITAVHDGRDVHMLGYFIGPESAALADFLATQRERRVERLREIGRRLSALGAAIDVDELIAAAARRPGVSVGRPLVARALVAAGRAASLQEAFDRFLASGRPAFVPRTGESPERVIAIIHAAGGTASMAHPGLTRQPALMDSLAAGDLDAIEVYHSDHPAEVQAELLAFAQAHGLLVTGGSDFHGDDGDRALGGVNLPREAFDRLAVRHRR